MLTCSIVFTNLITFYLLMYVPCIQLVISLMKVLFVCECFRLQVYTCKCFTTFRCWSYILSTSLLYPYRILYPRCIYFMYFALVVCRTCNWSLWLVFIALHVRMSIYLLNVHFSHSLMIDLVWSRYAYMFCSVYKLDCTLLAHICTMYSTCHKLNESFVCVRVF